MSKKVIFFFTGAVFLLSFRVASASPIINEVFYSPASKEWIEVYNDSDADIDITQYKVLDAGAAVNGHSISAVSGGSNIIPARGYGIIAKDITSVSAIYLFHASLGISSTANDTIVLKTNGNVADTVPISPNSAVDGNSLQLINGSWVPATPTPGALNQASNSNSNDSGNTNDSNSGSNNDNNNGDNGTNTGSNTSTGTSSTGTSGGGSSPVKKISAIQKTKAQIIAKSTAYVGAPFAFQGMAFGIYGEQLLGGKYFWNFGDGDSRELNAYSTDKFTHTYFYPGDYDILFEYYPNYFADTPDVSTKITVKVIAPTVSISSVGGAGDFFVELSNDTSYDADLSNWILASDNKIFKIPKNTILAPQKKIIISSRITDFSVSDKNTLKLLNSAGYIAYDYSPATVPAKIVAENYTTQKSNQNKNLTAMAEIPPENLPASAASGDTVNNDGEGSAYAPLIPVVSLVFIVGSAGAVYFIRRKKVLPEASSDFEILDE
jgi:hypothetical protein